MGTANEASRVRYRDVGFSAIDNVVSVVPTSALLTPAMTSGSKDWFIITQSTIIWTGTEWWHAF